MNQFRKIVLLMACLLVVGGLGLANGLPALCVTAIAADLGLSVVQCGTFLGAGFLGSVLSIAAAGPLGDRFGWRIVLVVGCFAQICGWILVSFSDTPLMLRLAATLVGLGSGVMEAIPTPLVCALFPKNRTRITNFLHAAYPVGFIAVILFAVFCIGTVITWRTAYRIAISVPVIAGLIFLAVPTTVQPAFDLSRSFARLFKSTYFYVLCGVFFLIGVSEVAPTNWIPSFVEKTMTSDAGGDLGRRIMILAGDPRRAGSIGMLLFMAAMLIARAVVVSRGKLWSSRSVLAGGAIVTAFGLLIAAAGSSPQWILVALAIVGFGAAALWPTGLALGGDVFPEYGATLYSILAAMGCMGGSIGTYLAGCAADEFGLRTAMGLMAIAPIGVLLGVLIRK